jgi:hypothetical protein
VYYVLLQQSAFYSYLSLLKHGCAVDMRDGGRTIERGKEQLTLRDDGPMWTIVQREVKEKGPESCSRRIKILGLPGAAGSADFDTLSQNGTQPQHLGVLVWTESLSRRTISAGSGPQQAFGEPPDKTGSILHLSWLIFKASGRP